MSEPATSSLIKGRYWNEVASIDAPAEAHRLGSGGLFVATDAAPKVGTLLEFELTIGTEAPVGGIVEVLEARRGDAVTDDSPAGMRVKFIHLDDPDHARDLIQRAVLRPSASIAPPPPDDPDAPPPQSQRGALWDRAVALEDAFFERAAAAPVSVSDDAVADALAARRASPEYRARQQKLRRTVAIVVGVAAIAFVATAVRGVPTSDGDAFETARPQPSSPRPSIAASTSAAPYEWPKSPAEIQAERAMQTLVETLSSSRPAASSSAAPAAASAAPSASSAPVGAPSASSAPPAVTPGKPPTSPPPKAPKSRKPKGGGDIYD